MWKQEVHPWTLMWIFQKKQTEKSFLLVSNEVNNGIINLQRNSHVDSILKKGYILFPIEQD